MEITIATTMMGVLLGTVGLTQKSETNAIKEVIAAFALAGDNNDAASMEEYLDDNFRIVMNRLFGSKTVSVMPRAAYLAKIKAGELGGDKRKVTVEEIMMNGAVASAKVTLEGTKMTFTSLLTLIRDESGSWKLVSDVPSVK